MARRMPSQCVVAAAFLMTVSAADAGQEYIFTHVDDFLTNYNLSECYIFAINDQNVACGMATIQIGHSITYTGFYWTPTDEKTAVAITEPKAINNNGLMAGVAEVYDIPTGDFTVMPLLPSTYDPVVLLGLNDADRAVGYVKTCQCSNSQGFQQVPYVWDATNGAHTLAVPGADGAARVNNNELVVGWIGGWAMTNSYVYDLNTDTFTIMSSVFDEPSPQTTAVDINDKNVVVGSRKNSDGTIITGYTWSAEAGVTLMPFPPPPFIPRVRPSAINDKGVIVGTITMPDLSIRAFVYDNVNGIRDLNTLTTVTTPGFVMRTATAINESGWIVGYGNGGDGGFYTSFVLTPVQTADLNGDGVVDAADLAILLGAWGGPDADLNNDGTTDAADLAILLGEWS